MKYFKYILLIAVVSVMTTACGTYTATPSGVDLLWQGMPKQEVDKIMGYPRQLMSVNYYREGTEEIFLYVTYRNDAYAIEYWNNTLVGYEQLYDRYSQPSYVPSQPYPSRPSQPIVRPPANRPGNNYQPSRPGNNNNNNRPGQNNRPERPNNNRPGNNDNNQGRPSENNRPGSGTSRPDNSGSTSRPNENNNRPGTTTRPSTRPSSSEQSSSRPSTRPSSSEQTTRPSSSGRTSTTRENTTTRESNESNQRNSSPR